MNKNIIYKIKQKIERNNGKMNRKYYINDRGQRHGLFIDYWYGGGILYKTNYVNGELHGLDTIYYLNKIEKQTYYL